MIIIQGWVAPDERSVKGQSRRMLLLAHANRANGKSFTSMRSRREISRRTLPVTVAVAGAAARWQTGSMSTDVTYPYSLEIRPCKKPEGHFTWVIRERGTLLQRSDKPHSSEELARKKGEAEIERRLGSVR